MVHMESLVILNTTHELYKTPLSFQDMVVVVVGRVVTMVAVVRVMLVMVEVDILGDVDKQTAVSRSHYRVKM